MQNGIGRGFALRLMSVAMSSTVFAVCCMSKGSIGVLKLQSSHRLLAFDPLCGSLVGAGRTVQGVSFDRLRADGITLLQGGIIDASISTIRTKLKSQDNVVQNDTGNRCLGC